MTTGGGAATHRWLRVGQSNDPDGRTAGAAAARGALGEADPRLLVVFCWDGYDLPAQLEGIRDEAGDLPANQTLVVLALA